MSLANIKRHVLFYLMISLGIISCQKSSEEVTPLDDLRSFTTNSDLAVNLQRVTLLDGSSDNFFDNASCIKLSIPFNAIVNQEEILIENDEDLQAAQLIYEQNPYARGNFDLIFPIRVVTSEYTEMTLDSEEALNQLAAQCIENGEDEDIECIDFTYPISISSYNRSSQQIGNDEISNDRDFYNFLQNIDEEELLGIDFPIEMINADGALISINNNDELNTAISTESIGCEENDFQYFNNGLALQQVSLQLTDAPFPSELVKEANVTIGRIDIYTNDDNDSIPFITISDEAQSFNLLDLTNGLTTDLAETDLPIGLYDHIRMEVIESSVELEDGSLFDLKVPSGSIRLVGDEQIEVTEGESLELLADFDVSRSFVVQGNPNTPAGIKGFLFKPVVKLSDLSKSGTLKGTVTQSGNGLRLEGVQVSVFAADTLNTTSFTDSEGNYTILGLEPGQYDITAEKDGFSEAMVDGIEVIQNLVTIQDIILNEE